MLLDQLLSPNQFAVISAFINNGEEKEYYSQILDQITKQARKIPKLYEQEELGKKARIYFKYFNSYSTIYITELDEDGRAFGYVDMGGERELGYVYLPEVIENNYEMDLYWDDTTTLETVMQ